MSSGGNNIQVFGQRKLTRVIQLSSSSHVFSETQVPKAVTVTNTGNDFLNVTGITNPDSRYWDVSIAPANLAPGQSTTFSISRNPAENLGTYVFEVLTNKTDGNNTFTATCLTRTLTLSELSFPTFGGTSATQPFTLYNSGNDAITIYGISSSNPRFVINPASSTLIPPQGSHTVNITYNPTDFSLQATTVSVSSNGIWGTYTKTASAQRIVSNSLSVSPSFITIKPSSPTQTIYIYNNGNTDVTINNATGTNMSSFNISTLALSGGIYSSQALPYVLPPGFTMRVVVTTKNNDYTSVNGSYITIGTSIGSYSINVSRTSGF